MMFMSLVDVAFLLQLDHTRDYQEAEPDPFFQCTCLVCTKVRMTNFTLAMIFTDRAPGFV